MIWQQEHQLREELAAAKADREQVTKAQEAMGNGADDSRWRPGETAVDALIRERDEAKARAERAEKERDAAAAAVGLLRQEIADALDEFSAAPRLRDGVLMLASSMRDFRSRAEKAEANVARLREAMVAASDELYESLPDWQKAHDIIRAAVAAHEEGKP